MITYKPITLANAEEIIAEEVVSEQISTSTGTVEPALDGSPTTADTLWTLVQSSTPILLVVVVFYFLVLRPQQKKVREHQNMLSALKIGENVLTSGGVIGTVVKMDGEVVSIEVCPNVEIKVRRDMISGKYSATNNDGSKETSARKKPEHYNGKRHFNRRRQRDNSKSGGGEGGSKSSSI